MRVLITRTSSFSRGLRELVALCWDVIGGHGIVGTGSFFGRFCDGGLGA